MKYITNAFKMPQMMIKRLKHYENKSKLPIPCWIGVTCASDPFPILDQSSNCANANGDGGVMVNKIKSQMKRVTLHKIVKDLLKDEAPI